MSRVINTARVIAELARQRAVPYWPRERLEAERDRNLRRTVRLAAVTVPYYRSLFQSLRLDSREIRTAADLGLLPLLDRSAVQEDPLALVSTESRGEESVEFLTSGSTGTPVHIFHDAVSIVMNLAYAEPEKEVIREAFGRRAYRQIDVLYPKSTVRSIQSVYRARTLLGLRLPPHFLNIEEPLEHLAAAINRLRPDVVTGYGSFFESLFQFVHSEGLNMHLPRLVVYGADAMTAAGRGLIEKTFGIQVHSRYNSVESFRIGFTCAAGQGFHLRDDLCYVRVVDSQGIDVPCGIEGEIVISNLVNRGSVLLNYRLGDVGALGDGPCPCGRTLRRLTALHGRVEDYVYLADGRYVHPRTIWSVFKKRGNILRYQVVQESIDTFTVKVAVSSREAFQALLPEIETELRERLGQTRYHFEYFARPEMLGTGKFRAVISNVAPPARRFKDA